MCTGFLNFENCLSITGAKTKTDGGARTRYIYIYLSIYIYIYIDIYRYIYIIYIRAYNELSNQMITLFYREI